MKRQLLPWWDRTPRIERFPGLLPEVPSRARALWDERESRRCLCRRRTPHRPIA